jgi:hypothetical protein
VKGYFAGGPLHFGELIIENAPCLERVLQLGSYDPHISVISAPKVETLGFISSDAKLALGFTVIQVVVPFLLACTGLHTCTRTNARVLPPDMKV